MFSVIAALVILGATAALAVICIALLREPADVTRDGAGERPGTVRRVRSKCGKVREYQRSDIPPEADPDLSAPTPGPSASGTRAPGTNGAMWNGPQPPMFPGLITMRRLLYFALDRIRPVAARAGLPIPAGGKRVLHGQVVSLAGTMVEPWEDAVRRLGIEYPLEDQVLARRAVEAVQAAWGRMAGDEPRMTPMAQRIAITGLLSDDACRKALAHPSPRPSDWIVDRAITLLTRQVMVASGRRAGSGR
jgi:hypothetical protein